MFDFYHLYVYTILIKAMLNIKNKIQNCIFVKQICPQLVQNLIKLIKLLFNYLY